MPAYTTRHAAALLSVGVRGLAVIAGFGLTFWIGRTLGPEANGQYALVTQTAMFLSVLAVGGLDLAVVREFSRAIDDGRRLARAALTRTLGATLVLSGLMVAGLALLPARWIDRVLDGDLPTFGLAAAAVLLMGRSLTRITGAVLRSQTRYVGGQVVEILLIPAGALLLVLFGVIHDTHSLLVATAVVGALAGLAGVVASARLVSTAADAFDPKLSSTLRTALPLWGVVLALSFSEWYGLSVVAAKLSVADAGLYRVAVQIAGALGIVLTALFGVYAPKFSAAFHLDDLEEVGRLGRESTLLSAALVLPAAGVLVLFARPLLAFIDPVFASGVPALLILLAGQVLSTLTGPAGMVLAMTGHGRYNLIVTVGGVAMLAVLAPVGSRFGIEGVAIAISLSAVARNLVSFVVVRRLIGVNVITGHCAAAPDLR